MVCAVGAFWELQPFASPVRSWVAASLIALLGAALVLYALSSLRSADGRRRFAGLSAIGGALAAAAILHAALLVGAPARVAAAPGQIARLSAGSSVRVTFPEVPTAGGAWPDSVVVMSGSSRTVLSAGGRMRTGAYALQSLLGPIALVRAAAPDGRSLTITQRFGSAFASPYLTFPTLEAGQPADQFEVPALHRDVRVAYYAGLPARHIDIPFLLVQIDEENGSALYQGVAVSDRPLRKAGVSLRFTLGTYPVVIVGSAPAALPLGIALCMTAVGLGGYLWTALRRGSA